MAASRIAGLLLAASVVAPAAEPSLRHLFPIAGTQGTTVSVTASGKFDPWPVKAWVSAPGIVFNPEDKAGKFAVEIAQDAAPGPHLVRLFNDAGASQPRFFIVSPAPELTEKEPNDDFRTPQKIGTLPATIGGRLDRAGDVDGFAVALKKGETLTAWLEGYVLASTFDGLLRIVDERGTQCAFSHDGRTLDPWLAWTASRDGTFTVQVMGFVLPARADVALTGGEGCVYRLHVATERIPRVAFEPQHGEIAERESGEAQSVALPAVIAGCIGSAGDEDRFTFTAGKGRVYELRITAAGAGSLLDAWLRVEGKDAKQLVRSDDAGASRDPLLVWTAPGDGVFTATVGDLTHRGGDDYRYRLVIAEATPTIRATTASHALSITSGKTAEVKVAVKRANGFKAKLRLGAKHLPAGVSAAEADVPDKDGEVTLKLEATAEVVEGSGPFALVMREVESGTEHAVNYLLTSAGENNGVPQGFSELVINATDRLWLTVIAPPTK